ncbi:MAG: hypothetical protein IPH06_05040 [Alphaproteobacteria bacterium]|nr:hypothetical protein [Alphaproteobacteria bacterium]QQS57389.1 MAG: hypothetical protein IPN28_00800 [Alphaproteobacteria bacterium]
MERAPGGEQLIFGHRCESLFERDDPRAEPIGYHFTQIVPEYHEVLAPEILMQGQLQQQRFEIVDDLLGVPVTATHRVHALHL